MARDYEFTSNRCCVDFGEGTWIIQRLIGGRWPRFSSYPWTIHQETERVSALDPLNEASQTHRSIRSQEDVEAERGEGIAG